MNESCLVYWYSGIQSLFEVVLLYAFNTMWYSILKSNQDPMSHGLLLSQKHELSSDWSLLGV